MIEFVGCQLVSAGNQPHNRGDAEVVQNVKRQIDEQGSHVGRSSGSHELVIWIAGGGRVGLGGVRRGVDLNEEPRPDRVGGQVGVDAFPERPRSARMPGSSEGSIPATADLPSSSLTSR